MASIFLTLNYHLSVNAYAQTESPQKHDGYLDFEAAQPFLKSKDPEQQKKGLALAKKAANEGDDRAEGFLATLIEEEDPKQAFILYKKSASQGNDKAEFYVGFSYFFGKGVTQNTEQAKYWLQKSVDQGNDKAEALLGEIYCWYDINKNSLEGAKLLQKSADQGNPIAQLELGKLYLFGDGVPQDDQDAIAWFEESASQGVSEAGFYLGIIYKQKGDELKAYYWLKNSADQGNEKAIKLLRP